MENINKKIKMIFKRGNGNSLELINIMTEKENFCTDLWNFVLSNVGVVETLGILGDRLNAFCNME
jgi:hypothetical protein